MLLTQLIADIITSLFVLATPGPATITLFAFASRYGTAPVLPYLRGIIAGFFINIFFVSLISFVFFLNNPGIMIWMQLAFLFFMIYLCYQLLHFDPKTKAEHIRVNFKHGVILNLINPKAAFAGLMIYIQMFHWHEVFGIPAALLVLLVNLSIAYGCQYLWCVAGSMAGKYFLSKFSKRMNFLIYLFFVLGVLALVFKGSTWSPLL